MLSRFFACFGKFHSARGRVKATGEADESTGNVKPEWIERMPSVKSIRLSCASLSSIRASFRAGSSSKRAYQSYSRACYTVAHESPGTALLIKNYRPSNSRPASFNSSEASRTIHRSYPRIFSALFLPPAALFKLSLRSLSLSFSLCFSPFSLSLSTPRLSLSLSLSLSLFLSFSR